MHTESGEAKFSSTSVRYKNGDGKYRIEEIRFGGTTTRSSSRTDSLRVDLPGRRRISRRARAEPRVTIGSYEIPCRPWYWCACSPARRLPRISSYFLFLIPESQILSTG